MSGGGVCPGADVVPSMVQKQVCGLFEVEKLSGVDWYIYYRCAARWRRVMPLIGRRATLYTHSNDSLVASGRSAVPTVRMPSLIRHGDDSRPGGKRGGGGGRDHRHRIDKYLVTLLATQTAQWEGFAIDHSQYRKCKMADCPSYY